MSAAFKSAMIQTFCIPLAGSQDPDRANPRAKSAAHLSEPVQGWDQWAKDIEDIVAVCDSAAAIELVQERNRQLLLALSRERQALYQELGECFGARREVLEKRAAPRQRKRPAPRTKAGASAPALEAEDA